MDLKIPLYSSENHSASRGNVGEGNDPGKDRVFLWAYFVLCSVVYTQALHAPLLYNTWSIAIENNDYTMGSRAQGMEPCSTFAPTIILSNNYSSANPIHCHCLCV